MRIDCEICGATYAIDDALLHSGSVRARCPQCGTQQVVRAPTVNPPGHEGAHAVAADEAGVAPPMPPALQVLPPMRVPPAGPGASAPPADNQVGPPQGAAPVSLSVGPFAGTGKATESHVSGLDVETSRNANPFLSSAGSQAAAFQSSVFAPSGSRVANPFAGALPSSPAMPAPGANPFFEPSGSQVRHAASFVVTAAALPTAPGYPPGPPPGSPPAGPRPVTLAQVPAARTGAGPDAGATDPALRAPSLPRIEEKVLAADLGGALAEPGGHLSRTVPDARPPVDPDVAPLELGAQPDDPADLWTGIEERWQVRSSMTTRADLTLAQVETMIRRGALGPFDEASLMGQPLVPIAQHPALAALLPTGRSAAAAPQAGGRGAAAHTSRPARRSARLPALAATLLLGSVGGAGWWATHPDALPLPPPAPLIRAAALLRATLGDTPPATLDSPALITQAGPFAALRDVWAAQLPATQSSVPELIAQARKEMLLDTPEGQRAADALFRSAILLEATNVEAIAGYLQNFADSTEAKVDAASLLLAQGAMAWAKDAAPDHPGVLMAETALHLSQGDLTGARRAIARRMTVAAPDPESELLLARVMLDVDPDESLRIVNRVRRSAPSMAAALTVAAATHRRLGDYKRARDFLEERISTAPNHGQALKERARLDLDVRDGKAASQWLEQGLRAEDRDIEAHLMRAKITYQLMNDWQQAEEQLRFVIDHLRSEAGALLRDAYVHYATVLAETGQLDLALKMADQGITLDPNHAPLRVARARALAARGDLQDAVREFEQALGFLEARDEARATAWVRTRLGELQARAGKEGEAERTLLRATSEAPREARAALALMALYMRRGEPARANLYQRKLLDLDPMAPAERFELTDYYEKPAPLSDYAADIRDAVVTEEERSQQKSAEGMMRFYGGQAKAARKLFEAALKFDPLNHPALLFLSVLDLNAKKAEPARKRLRQAERQVAGQHTITQLYLARAEADTGALADAQSRLETVVDQEPTLAGARYRLAEVLDRRGNAGAASELFREVLRSHPDYVPVKRRLAFGDLRKR